MYKGTITTYENDDNPILINVAIKTIKAGIFAHNINSHVFVRFSLHTFSYVYMHACVFISFKVYNVAIVGHS